MWERSDFTMRAEFISKAIHQVDGTLLLVAESGSEQLKLRRT
jgi:hypothetical protein